MITKTIIDEYLLVSKILFEKNFLNVGIGSISLKLQTDKMIINKQNKHILEEDFFKTVHILKSDLSWKETSVDIKTHSKIYETNSSTKAIANIFPINTITFSMKKEKIFKPIDFLGKKILSEIPIITIENSIQWEENKEFIISKKLKEYDIIIIKGYGVYIKTRDIKEILKKSIILENSAKILLNS